MTRCFTVHNFSIKTRELVWSCGHSYSQQARACVKVISLRTHVCDNARGEIRLSDWQAALGWVFHSAAKKVYTGQQDLLSFQSETSRSKWCPKRPILAHGLNWLYGFAWKVQIFPQLFRVEGSKDGRSFIDLMLLLIQPARQQDPRCQSPVARFLCRAASRYSSEWCANNDSTSQKKWSNLTKLTRLNEHLDLLAMTWIISGHPALCDHPGADGDCPQHLTLSPVRSL